jgi:hypothetical protein
MTEETESDFEEDWERGLRELERMSWDFNNYFGKVAEDKFHPYIIQKFEALGYEFNETSGERMFFNRETYFVEAVFDMFLENREYTIVVKLITDLSEEDVAKYVNSLEFLRGRKDKSGDKREIRGAVAGADMTEQGRRAALATGLYAIEPSGHTIKIEEPQHIRGW